MHPVAWQLLNKTNHGGGHRNPAAAWLLLFLCLHGFPLFMATCPPYCLCASDIVSCSGHGLPALPSDLPGYARRLDLSHNSFPALPQNWSTRPFQRLVALVLSWNSISQIDPDAFTITPQLLHLDLSSNQLTVLNSSTFHGLEKLEVLLLFGNQIAQINLGTFSDLRSLQRLYLSRNRVTTFPAELYIGLGGPRNLTFLDLSSNRLSHVPVQDLLSLPTQQQGGIYLHGNPLACDSVLLAMLEYWLWKQYRPLMDFIGDYPCKLDGNVARPGVERVSSQQALIAATYKAEPGDWLRVACPEFAIHSQGEQVLFWVTPRSVLNSSADDPSDHLLVFPDGTLEIQGALLRDSGMYSCVATRGHPYDPKKSLEVRVVVGNSTVASASDLAHSSSTKHFNTAFTTLASCVISIVLVLLYLYLTPCRCRESRGRGCGGRALVLCSDPREADSQRKKNGKRVAFLEPQADDSKASVPKSPLINSGHVATEGILKNGSRTVGQTFTDSDHVA
ncbi:amphoterin-induced protein 2-like [Genypterus blacodes]|uniref:amphoterin-induced protein 2-like n=1 Tax=Genypterus blacodes TaxID=154954 RepID=UPI003F770854